MQWQTVRDAFVSCIQPVKPIGEPHCEGAASASSLLKARLFRL
jgi:hypothetical protein